METTAPTMPLQRGRQVVRQLSRNPETKKHVGE